MWLIANDVGGNEPLAADPTNAWAATLVLAIALDPNRPSVDFAGRRDQAARGQNPP